MCGIAGIVSFSGQDSPVLERIEEATKCIALRGPDGQGIFRDRNIAFGHRRLAVIDTSASANQPMQDATGRYTIIFNGEFFNFKQHRAYLESKGVTLRTESDTEVLLYLYILEGTECLKKVNGFFSLAIYDKQEQTIFLARDRMGIKPLLYYIDEEKFLFASEMKALMAMGIPKEIDYTSLLQYFQFYYIPAPNSIFKNVKKLLPGTFALLKATDKNSFKTEKYYSIPKPQQGNYSGKSYDEAQKELFELMELSVQRRLVSDVPLGTFLSGGIDSSVVTALAALHKPNIKTFSIGFKDNSFYDETHFAEAVARKCHTDHSVFRLSKDDLFANLHSVLEYMDEPFADSSALPVHILSMHTRRHVTVALSGDGADEIFGGYNKHFAELLSQKFSTPAKLLQFFLPLIQKLPLSRSNKYANKIRQAERLLKSASLPMDKRYLSWASFNEQQDVLSWIRKEKYNGAPVELRKRIDEFTASIQFTGSMNDIFYADTQLVLPNDMLTKVDLMSMANSLEVRVPFLDYEVVNFAFSLPENFKIDMSRRKKIVRDAFKRLLPDEVYSRGKKGLEVPLLDWFRGELKSMITNDLLSDEMLDRQGIFEKQAIKKILHRLYSSNPGDAPLQVWSLIVFQYWWKKYLSS